MHDFYSDFRHLVISFNHFLGYIFIIFLDAVVRQRHHLDTILRPGNPCRLRIWVRFPSQRRLRGLLHHEILRLHRHIFHRGRQRRRPRRGIAKPTASNNQMLLFCNPKVNIATDQTPKTNPKSQWKNAIHKKPKPNQKTLPSEGSQKKSQWMFRLKNLSHHQSRSHWRVADRPRKSQREK